MMMKLVPCMAIMAASLNANVSPVNKNELIGGASLSAQQKAIEEDVIFWARQFKEHAEFCNDFTNNPEYKIESNTFRDLFDRIAKSTGKDADTFLKTSAAIKKFQKKVYASLDKNDSDYSIKKDLIDHMNLETDYVIKKVKGEITPEEEIAFWIQEHEGEAKAMNYFMRPEVINLKKKSEAIEKQLEANYKNIKNVSKDKKSARVSKARTALQQANAELNDLGMTLDKNPRANRMPAKLAKHEKREREKAQQILETLKK